ncbi:MAG: type I methionyl aminopeptidase [Chloroflexi bacterium AL-W]|nr:type I methionyl aminopeptidase [Chloroflexi bacterium AL-N1]NOK68356.1 type I methionyl aminopeptidase [Chloroflexi bacterium AL-N10]NOK74002.1 type I methionyl aminopeptidase [Chloroflexi bacterium AL-N5]NOK82970.1 type I methionyl aminopeptidase [Chloroflexi bacterium AL-W]NOK90492.1 type I methionyl aminopeptidase [Chloroflexi bacterium AL-N15]
MTIENPLDLQVLMTIGRIVGQTLQEMRTHLRPGITTEELDDIALAFLTQHQACSAPMLEVDFPRTTCISINDEACHGLPGTRRVQPGDLVTLDVAAECDGYYADAAITVAVPPITPAHKRLCAAAEASLLAAIGAARVGQSLAMVGRAAEQQAHQSGYRIVRRLHGHGIGRRMHEAPHSIPSFYHRDATYRLHDGVVLALEPHLTTGNGRLIEHSDGWTIKTRDQKRVAVYEHTIIVTRQQPIIVTAL